MSISELRFIRVLPDPNQENAHAVINLIGPNVAPFRREYIHSKCGSATNLIIDAAKTLAKHPRFYTHLYCITCHHYFPVEQFYWKEDMVKVGKITKNENYDFKVNGVSYKSTLCALTKYELIALVDLTANPNEYDIFILDKNDNVISNFIEPFTELFLYNNFKIIKKEV